MIDHAQIYFAVVLVSTVALLAWLFWMLPRFSRPGIFFAVTVVPHFRESNDANHILKSYRAAVLLHSAIAFALLVFGAMTKHFVISILGFLWLIGGPLTAISAAHKKTLHHAMPVPTIREAALAPRSAQLPGGWIVQAAPFALLLITAAYVRAHWDVIPARFPSHWGADGLPNGWSTRTPHDVYAPLLFGAGLVAIISLLTYALSHAARRIATAANLPKTSDRGHRFAVVMVGVEFLAAATFSLVALLPFTGNPGLISLIAIALMTIIGGVVLVRSWLNHDERVTERVQSDGTPDSAWKFGLFYYNPDDSALFVEKRIGIGYTFNFARPTTWVLLIVIILLPLLLAALLAWHHKSP